MSVRFKSAGALVQAVKMAKSDPEAVFHVPGGWPITGQEVLEIFRAGLSRRCNRGLSVASDDYAAALSHDARIIQDAARNIRWSGRNLLKTRRLQKRYPHLHNPS